ncbi:MAG: ATP-binding protein, partial [Dehalococcoidia bacterium]
LVVAVWIDNMFLVLRGAAGSFPASRDGVFVVSLAPITDPALVLSTIAQTFNLQESESRRLRETVTDYLRAKQMRLVLDNVEQVPGAAPLLAELLSACPRLKLLVTSRSPLHLRGEQEVVLPPLGLPGPQHLPSIEDLRQSEAVQLFVERARAVRLDFALSDENATVVAEICRRLDGLPLAIELAAARVKLLPPQALLRRLAHQLPVLTGGARDLPARQQTLRATIGWSYDLLNAREQLMFRGLSVFVGGCSLEAAEAIADVVDGEQGIETRDGSFAPDTLDLVASLVDKNLLGQEERQGEPRFVLLETIREYGLEQLDEHGDTTAFQRRHAEYYLVLAEAAEPRLRTREQASAFELLGREHDNLRAALRWFEEQGEAGAELRLAGALAWFWFLRGHWNEGAAWLEAGLAIPGPAPAAARAKALAGAGLLTAYLGGSATAEARVMESVTLWRQLDDRAGIAASQLVRGLVASRLGDQVAPRAAWEESLAMYRMLGDQWGIAEALNYLGTLARRTGEYAMARGLLQECLAIARQAGLRSEVAWSLDMLGTLAVEDHDYAAARSLYDESLAIRRELGLRPSVGSSLGRLGDLARRQGDYTTAQTLLREGLALSWELGNWQTAALCLRALAGVMLGQGQPEHAVRLYGATEAERERLAVPLQPLYRTEYEDAVPRVRARLGEERFAAAWAAGRAMSLEQAVAYALEEPARPV